MAPPHTVTIALVQMACAGQKDENIRKARQRIGEAAAQGADVVCLQELFAIPYPCQEEAFDRFAEAEAIPGPTTEALAEAARRHRVVVIGSVFERRAPGLYHNTAVVLERDGSLAARYRKMHIPDDPGYYEKFYFTPGDLGFRSVRTSAGNLGVLVCWDQWFPEAARLTALRGAEILCYPTAIGWLPEDKEAWGRSQYESWQVMMRSHAIANGVFVAAPNRVGKEGAIQFWGGSFVADPYGRVLAQAPHEEEALVVCRCDRAQVEAARQHWPFLRDRRVDAYHGLLQRWDDAPEGPAR